MTQPVGPMSQDEAALWQAVYALQAQVAELRTELDQHYSNHQVEANNRASTDNP